MQSTVTIRDYPCGSGKTTSMIEGFRSDRKYLVIVPLLTEVDRVVEWSKSTPFQQPHANDNNAPTKTESLESMVLQGQNIAATSNFRFCSKWEVNAKKTGVFPIGSITTK